MHTCVCVCVCRSYTHLQILSEHFKASQLRVTIHSLRSWQIQQSKNTQHWKLCTKMGN